MSRVAAIAVPTVALVAFGASIAALSAQTVRPAVGAEMSAAERRYVAPAATTRIADGRRTLTRGSGYNRKFATENTQPTVRLSNPFMDPAKPIFARAARLQCMADGSVVVGGRAGFDADARVLGTGWWRIATDGAVTPLVTRSADAYSLKQGTVCNAPFGKTKLAPDVFAAMPDGRILAADASLIVSVLPNGGAVRTAGADDCDRVGPGTISGLQDGPSGTARFDTIDALVPDGDGNVWIADQKGCALRRLDPAGRITTVIGPDVVCDQALAQENRLLLDNLTWDATNRELVSGGSRTVARPVHTLYTTVWRIKPSGEYRRVLFATKNGRNPAKVNIDGPRAVAVDPKGRIFVMALLMAFERRGEDALQLMRVDETADPQDRHERSSHDLGLLM